MMTHLETLHRLEQQINQGWEHRDQPEYLLTVGEAVEATLVLLDLGKIRVAEKVEGAWRTHQWIKKAILLSFRLSPNRMMPGAPGNHLSGGSWYDKVESKFATWDEGAFQAAQIRAVPGALVRRSSFIGPKVILMPSFVNVGAHVGEGTMVDTWVTIGSCAQVGKHCHISGGVGLGGVLEPLQADPVIIEDNCFIGARSEIAEGVIVEEGSVISMGVFLGASTKIVDRATGEILRGRVPAYSVVVPGTLAGEPGQPALSCAVIVKRVDAQTRAKTSLNDLLRF